MSLHCTNSVAPAKIPWTPVVIPMVGQPMYIHRDLLPFCSHGTLTCFVTHPIGNANIVACLPWVLSIGPPTFKLGYKNKKSTNTWILKAYMIMIYNIKPTYVLICWAYLIMIRNRKHPKYVNTLIYMITTCNRKNPPTTKYAKHSWLWFTLEKSPTY